MVLLEATAASTAVAAAGAAVYGYRYGRFEYLYASLLDQCQSLDGSISLGRAADTLRRWTTRGFFGSYIGEAWASRLYRRLADVAAIRYTREVLADRAGEHEETDPEGVGEGFSTLHPPGLCTVPTAGGLVHSQATGNVGTAEKPVLRVRRGQRRRAARTVYHRVVAEIGLRSDSAGQREVVMDKTVSLLKEMNVRICDRPALMAEVQVLYATPLEEQLEAAAVLRNSWHSTMRGEITFAK